MPNKGGVIQFRFCCAECEAVVRKFAEMKGLALRDACGWAIHDYFMGTDNPELAEVWKLYYVEPEPLPIGQQGLLTTPNDSVDNLATPCRHKGCKGMMRVQDGIFKCDKCGSNGVKQ